VSGVSVALATFNGERYLGDQLASLAAQTVPPFELVVQDDGSTDGTLGLLEEFAASSAFPVLVAANEARLGFADTFLAAAGRCTGDAIAFCDQDDVWLPHKLARCRAALAQPGVVLAMHACRVVDGDLRPTGRVFPRYASSRTVARLDGDPWLAVRGMSMVFDARLPRRADRRPRPRSHYVAGAFMHHDEWIYTLARAAGAVALIAEPLALYMQHGDNVAGAAGGLAALVREIAGTGWTYYRARRDQALDAEEAFRELAAQEDDAGLRSSWIEAADAYGRDARRLELRLAVYEPGTPPSRRASRLVRLARAGRYGRGGFGAAAFFRDALMVALRRTG
jgi:glycosyltransferase involved in cell wall biosynthesis